MKTILFDISLYVNSESRQARLISDEIGRFRTCGTRREAAEEPAKCRSFGLVRNAARQAPAIARFEHTNPACRRAHRIRRRFTGYPPTWTLAGRVGFGDNAVMTTDQQADIAPARARGGA